VRSEETIYNGGKKEHKNERKKQEEKKRIMPRRTGVKQKGEIAENRWPSKEADPTLSGKDQVHKHLTRKKNAQTNNEEWDLKT